MKKLWLFTFVYLLVSCSLPSWMVNVKQRSHIKAEQLSQDIDPVAPWSFPIAVDIEIPATQGMTIKSAHQRSMDAYHYMWRILRFENQMEINGPAGYINPFTDTRYPTQIHTGTVGNTIQFKQGNSPKKGN